MQIHIIAVGKIRERYFHEGIEEFTKRLLPYVSLKIREVADEPVPPRPSEVEERRAREVEGRSLLSAVPSGACCIALHPQGTEWSSDEFAQRIRNWEIQGPHTVVFLIGGELGLSPAVLSRADLQVSLSRMTFPHQMVRLILMEALYRSFRRIRGEPYHR